MSKQDVRWAVTVSVFVLLALGLAGTEDYQAAQVLADAPVVRVAGVRP